MLVSFAGIDLVAYYSSGSGVERVPVHAGVITTLADHTAGGSARAALPPGKDVLTLELKINFLRPGRSGRLEAKGRTLRAGRHIVVSEVEVFEATDPPQMIAKLVSTLTVLDERPFAR